MNKRNIFLIIVVVLLGSFFSYKKSLNPISPVKGSEKEINIEKGSNLNSIAEKLKESGLIKSKNAFKIRSKQLGLDNKFKAGKYNLDTSMSVDDIAKVLSEGSNDDTLRFTIPEGYELRQIAEKLSTEGIIDKERFLNLVSNKNNFEDEFTFLKELNNEQDLEGFLFPATYEIYEGEDEESIIKRMLNAFEIVYEEEIVDKLHEKELNLNGLITLASIVEREGKLDEERPLMAAVFYNRLDQNMNLGSCATVQFILGERKENLSTEDTKINSPYNTYINSGLPPAPIASPGRESIKAVMNPADVDYLYFVLTGDDGSHTFTKTYSEHLKAKTEGKNK